MEAPDTITCVECGGTAHRMGYPDPEYGDRTGDVVAYVCAECGHRHDIEIEDDEAGA